jgi:hypothetical protein
VRAMDTSSSRARVAPGSSIRLPRLPQHRHEGNVSGRTLKWLKVKQAKFREQERGFYKPGQAA